MYKSSLIMSQNFFKVFLVFFGIVFAEACSAMPSDFKGDLAILRLCNASSPVSLQAANSVLMYKNTNHPETKSRGFKCFILCLYVEYDWMDRVGGFQLHNIKSALSSTKLSEDQMSTLLYKCTILESTDPCERASDYTQCFWAHSKKDEVLDADVDEVSTESSAEGFYFLD